MKFTHTATITQAVEIGPWQFHEMTAPGDVVEVYQDPAQQEGDLITIRKGHSTGVAWIKSLTNVKEK